MTKHNDEKQPWAKMEDEAFVSAENLAHRWKESSEYWEARAEAADRQNTVLQRHIRDLIQEKHALEQTLNTARYQLAARDKEVLEKAERLEEVGHANAQLVLQIMSKEREIDRLEEAAAETGVPTEFWKWVSTIQDHYDKAAARLITQEDQIGTLEDRLKVLESVYESEYEPNAMQQAVQKRAQEFYEEQLTAEKEAEEPQRPSPYFMGDGGAGGPVSWDDPAASQLKNLKRDLGEQPPEEAQKKIKRYNRERVNEVRAQFDLPPLPTSQKDLPAIGQWYWDLTRAEPVYVHNAVRFSNGSTRVSVSVPSIAEKDSPSESKIIIAGISADDLSDKPIQEVMEFQL
jgi:hypothetical protein